MQDDLTPPEVTS